MIYLLKSDELASAVHNEIQKKLRQIEAQKEYKEQRDKPPKKTVEEELDEERKIIWDEEDYLKTYFLRERKIMEAAFGEEWKDFVKNKDLPRDKYFVEDRRSSSAERRRQKEIAAKAKKKKGGSIFRK